MAVTISSVTLGSPAQKAGLIAGMQLLSIDGHEINDGLDYEFYTAPSTLSLVVQCEKQQQTVLVHKKEYQQLGCEFESYLIDAHHTCRNNCVFCFVDQMPKGMRPSLYCKDDDERLSFLFGNYVTLTNLTDREVQRIIEMRISPINISVHTTNPALRVQMMKNKYAGEVLRYIPMLAEADIKLNTQLVLCLGVNDGEELRNSIESLVKYHPALQSIAAVPVGVTKHRDGLYPLHAYSQQEAADQLDILLEYGERYKQQYGVRIIYPSDEWFLLARRPIPAAEFYDDYPQLQNGIGMWRLFQNEFMDALKEAKAETRAVEVDLATGTLAYPLLQELAGALHAKNSRVQVHVHAIQNNFFGTSITVAGLLTGQDIAQQLAGKLYSKTLLLPDLVLRAEGDVFLDEMTLPQLEKKLNVHLQMVEQNGSALLDAILQAY